MAYAQPLPKSLMAHNVEYSASVRSYVQHDTDDADTSAPVEAFTTAGLKGTLHLAASGVTRMLVVVCRSQVEWRHTRPRSLVMLVSHSMN